MPETITILNGTTSHALPPQAVWTDDHHYTAAMKQPTRRLQPNLTRKSHTKSRRGCFTCKSRKIKCGEEKPACKNCMLKVTDCIYPPEPNLASHGIMKRSNSVCASVPTITCNFSLQDMQFFHHFLTLAYPHLPLGNDAIWVKEIPQFAQEHSYLMHAMLALGASHLGRISPTNQFIEKSLQHRGLAIAGLNKALVKSHLDYGEADALLATCYALTFQSTYMSDGLSDFVRFVRGCALTTDRIRSQRAQTAFDIRPDRHYEIVLPRLRHLPAMNPLHIFGGLEGLEALRPYLQTKADMDFYQAVYGIYVAFKSSSPEGYIEFVKIFSIWYELASEEFQFLLDPGNIPAQILFAYFIATELIVIPLSVQELPERMAGRLQSRTVGGIISWAHEIYKKVPPKYQPLLKWPKSIVATALAEISNLPYEGPAVLVNTKKLYDDDASMTDNRTQASSPMTI